LTWQILAETGVINPALFSKPNELVEALVSLHQGGQPAQSVLLTHVAESLKRVALAASSGILLGILVGSLMGASPPIYRLLDPLLTVLMPIPGIAMAPIFMVWLGFGNPTILAVGTLATLFPVIYNTAMGVRSIDDQLVRAARMMGVTRPGTLLKVYIPGATGYVLMGIKLGLARCWRTIIAVEFIAAADWGLGYMIWDAAEYLRSSVVYAGILLLIVIYFLVETRLIRPMEALTIKKWGVIQQ
jgi:ABC-type nitrate/sulfonate/bicarbonate transport system permease component